MRDGQADPARDARRKADQSAVEFGRSGLLRVMTLVEAVLALGIGVGGGFGFLYGTGDLKTSGEIVAMREKIDSELRRVEKERLDAIESARLAKVAAEAEAGRERERLAAIAAAAETARLAALAGGGTTENVITKSARFGELSIKAVGDNVSVDGGEGLKGSGAEVKLAFEALPAKLKVKSGKFTVMLTVKASGKMLGIDASVSPLAIVKADGVAVGTNASGLEIGRKPFTLEFNSPASGELKLLLVFRK